MWNKIKTDEYEGMIAESVTIRGENGDEVRTYFSRPLGKGPYPGIVLIPHMPGWDEFCREAARRFTQHGYMVACPDIYSRIGTGYPEEVSAMARQKGGVKDDSVMSDCAGALSFLKSAPYSNGKVGVIGMCSGGRHAYLAACKVEGFDAAVDCWGARVVTPDATFDPENPVEPVDLTAKLPCPLLGIFGNDDKFPTPEEVNTLEDELKKYGKDYKFFRYDGAGHGMWYYHNQMYRQQQAMDSWEKVFDFFEEKLK